MAFYCLRLEKSLVEKPACQAHTAVLPLGWGTEKNEASESSSVFFDGKRQRQTFLGDHYYYGPPTHNSTGLRKSAQLFSHQFLFQLATAARMAENTATEPHGHTENECMFPEKGTSY